MRVKNIVSLITFSAAFIFSVTLVGLPKNNFYSNLSETRSGARDRQNIRAFLWQDINRGRARNQTFAENTDPSDPLFNLNQLSETVENYVDEAQSADDSNLPADLQAAWQAHMNAWREHSNFLAAVKTKYSKNVNDTEFSADPFDFDDISQMNGKDNDEIFDDFDRQVYLNQSEKINQTWYQVLQVGRKHGVYVPVE